MKPIPLHLFVNHPLDAVLVLGLLALFGMPLYMGIRRYVSRRGLDV